MRYVELISEGKKKSSKEKLPTNEWQDLVKRDCKPYLSAKAPDKHLYRGAGGNITPGAWVHTFNPANGDFFKGKVRQETRKPMSTNKIQHDMLNDYFTRKFNAPYRNALFATGDKEFAAKFGDIYAIFPIGDFTFTWSPKVRDFVGLLHPSSSFMKRLIPGVKAKDQHLIDKQLDKLDYRNYDLPHATSSGGEVMIRCKEYYAVAWDIVADSPPLPKA